MSASAVEHAVEAVPETRRTPRRRGARLLNTLSLFGVTCTVLLACVSLVPTLLGYHRYVIVSGSMEPGIGTGSVVYARPVPVEDLKVGDIITFVPPPEYDIKEPVTHRIAEITVPDSGEQKGQRLFRTKGDANDSRDPWTMTLNQDVQDRVEGHLEKVGYLYMALSNRWVQLLAIGLPALLIAVAVARALWKEAGEAVRREQAQQETAGTAT